MMIGVFAGDTNGLPGSVDPCFFIRVDFLADFDHRESHFNNAQRLLSPNFPPSPSHPSHPFSFFRSLYPRSGTCGFPIFLTFSRFPHRQDIAQRATLPITAGGLPWTWSTDEGIPRHFSMDRIELTCSAVPAQLI